MTVYASHLKKTLPVLLMFVVTLSSLQRLPLATAEASPGASQALASNTCERAAENDVWNVDLSASYSRNDSNDQFESEVSQSANFTMVFTLHSSNANQVVWNASEVSGSGSVHGRDVRHFYDAPDEVSTVDGSGAPARFTGELKINRLSCTYDLWAWSAIDVTRTFTGSEPDQGLDNPLSFWVSNRPIPQDSGTLTPVLGSNESLPVFAVTKPDQGDAFDPSGAAEGVRTIAQLKGQETAGTAAVSWAARANPDQPYIANVRFTHEDVATSKPVEIGQDGTVDGNTVVIRTSIQNPRSSSVSASVRIVDAETNEALPKCQQTILLPSQYTTDLYCTWDTENWAWDASPNTFPDAHPNHRIKVLLDGDSEPLDTKEKPIIIRPKPLILVHDVNADRSSWDKYPALLAAVNPEWKAYAVSGIQMGKSITAQEKSITISENARIMANYVRDVRMLENARHVDIVAHGMGGIVAREYIHSLMTNTPTYDGRSLADHLVMLGTPNQGTECADIQLIANTFLLQDNQMALHELSPFSMGYFNEHFINRQGVKFSVLAGNSLMFQCAPKLRPLSDGFVTVESAHYIYNDIGLTSTFHFNMASDQADFLFWVFPHVAEGRSAPALAEAESMALTQTDQPAYTPLQFTQVTSRTLAAGASTDLVVPFAQASSVGVAVITEAGVAATLHNPEGAPVQEIPANSPAAQQGVRVLWADAPTPGDWTLHLENTGSQTVPVSVVVLIDGGSLAVSDASSVRGDDGRASISVKMDNTAASTHMTAELLSLLDGTRTPLELADDGAHGDGAANDGVYGGNTPVLADGYYRAIVQVTRGEEQRMFTLPIIAQSNPEANYTIFLPTIQR